MFSFRIWCTLQGLKVKFPDQAKLEDSSSEFIPDNWYYPKKTPVYFTKHCSRAGGAKFFVVAGAVISFSGSAAPKRKLSFWINILLCREGGAWWCERCRVSPSRCAVCHAVVRGLLVWCQGCGHGGHVHHLRQWMSQRAGCPAGCGHQCEYA